MTLHAFIGLDDMKQTEAIWVSTQMGERGNNELRIGLYPMDGFYLRSLLS